MTQETILTELGDGVLRVWLNRPEKLNALTPDMYRQIGNEIIQANENPDCKVIVLAGKGRAFSSGFDLKLEVANQPHTDRLNSLSDISNRTRWIIWHSTKPVIAEVHGYCLGGAFELMLPCDFTIASEDCQLGEPEIQFGSGPAFIMVPWMTNHKRAKDILLTGRRLSAHEALEAGLVTSVVPAGKVQETTAALTHTLKNIPEAALKMTKAGINRAYETMGMQAHLHAWTESTAYLSYMVKESGSPFHNIIQKDGTSAALEWRNQTFGALYSSSRKE